MALTRFRFSQANTIVARIQDPITVLNSESTLANVDVGFLINRDQGLTSNAAIYWSEVNDEFTLALTSNAGILDTNVTVSSYADLRIGSLYGNIGGGNTQSNTYITGSLLPSSNVAFDLGSTNNRFKTLWLSGNTIVMGKETLSVDDAGEWIFTSGPNTVKVGSLTNFQGNGAIVGNLTVIDTLTFQGNAYNIEATDLIVQDSIIELHTPANLAPLLSNDGRDIGFKFHYYDYQDEHAFLGRANDTGYLEWYDSGQELNGNTFSGNTYGTIKTGALWLVNNTISTSTTSGALRVVGGVGIGGALYIANTGDVSANIGAIKTNLETLDANVSAYQIWANANAVSQSITISSVESTVTGFQSNIEILQSNVAEINANVGAYQIWANANIAGKSVDIDNIVSTANANTAAYLLTATGNISAGNIITSGNIYGSIVPSAIFKDIFLGTTSVSLARASETLTVDNFNTTGYAATANSAALATNAEKIKVTSNISSGAAYVPFVSSIAGNVDQYVNTALTYNPNSGNLRAYGLLTDTGVFWAGNGVAFSADTTLLEANIGAYQIWSNANAAGQATSIDSIQANLGAYQIFANTNASTQATSINNLNSNTGAFYNYANSKIGTNANSSILASTIYTSAGIFWSGNGAAYSSGGGGGGITYTAATTPPGGPSVGDQWYDTSTDILYEYISNGTSSYWVDVQSLGIVGNIVSMLDTTLSGNIGLGLNNVYSIGSPSAYLKNIYVNNLSANSVAFNSNLVAAATTASSSKTTGALVVIGGAGIGGTLNANVLQALNSTNAPGITPEFKVANGNQALNIIANVSAGSYNSSTAAYDTLMYFTQGSQNTGNLLIAPWTNYASGIKISSTGRVTVTNTQSSTSTTTGALVVNGGAGIAGNVSADKVYTTAGIFWTGNGEPVSGGINTGKAIAMALVFGG